MVIWNPVAEGFVDQAGRFHPIRGSRGYDPRKVGEPTPRQRGVARLRRRQRAAGLRRNPFSLRRLFRVHRRNPTIAGMGLGGPLLFAAVILALGLFGGRIGELASGAGGSIVGITPSRDQLARQLLANNPDVATAYRQAGWDMSNPVAILDNFISTSPGVQSRGSGLDGFVRWAQATNWGRQMI